MNYDEEKSDKSDEHVENTSIQCLHKCAYLLNLNEEASSYEDGYIAKVGGLSIEDDATSLCFFLFLFKRVAIVGISQSVWNFFLINEMRVSSVSHLTDRLTDGFIW